MFNANDAVHKAGVPLPLIVFCTTFIILFAQNQNHSDGAIKIGGSITVCYTIVGY